jgi:hypothetical protein
MKREPKPDLYVMDTLANDLEDLEGVLRMLNSDTVLGWHREWGRKFQRKDVVEALSRLIRNDMVQAYVLSEDGKSLEVLPPQTLPPGSYDDAYFGLRPHGRIAHQNWEPATDA